MAFEMPQNVISVDLNVEIGVTNVTVTFKANRQELEVVLKAINDWKNLITTEVRDAQR